MTPESDSRLTRERKKECAKIVHRMSKKQNKKRYNNRGASIVRYRVVRDSSSVL